MWLRDRENSRPTRDFLALSGLRIQFATSVPPGTPTWFGLAVFAGEGCSLERGSNARYGIGRCRRGGFGEIFAIG